MMGVLNFTQQCTCGVDPQIIQNSADKHFSACIYNRGFIQGLTDLRLPEVKTQS